MLSYLSTLRQTKLSLPLEVDNIEFYELQNYGIQENGFNTCFTFANI